MIFVNTVADIAEEQGHHPDIEISYNKVEIELTTHAIGGLSVNDFILASKIEIL
jgi:4a-hydroxytetrahydrobiopterin dehydratase